MEKVRHSLETIALFNETAIHYVTKAETDTKLVYALKKFIGDPTTRAKGRLFPILKEYQNNVADMQIDLASTDEKTKVLLKDTKGNYEYTKEARKEMNKKLIEFQLVEYEIEPYYVADVDLSQLSEFEIGAFKDFVIK